VFSPSNLFYTYGLLIDGVAGFHHSIDCNIGFRMKELTSVFTVELAAIHMAMDSMSSIRAMKS
jgi:hypothetical protein